MTKLDEVIKDINRQYKENIISKGNIRNISEQIPFSSPRANYMLYGGLPRGKLIEFAGEEGGGKTTTALDISANAQKLFQKEWEEEIQHLEESTKLTKLEQQRLEKLKINGPQKVVYLDCENTLDEDWASLLKVNIEEMVIMRPMSQSAEQLFEHTLKLIETEQVGLIVIDSLGVMISQQAYEKTMEEKTYGGISMALTLFSRKAGQLCAKNNCTIIGINQLREDMNSTWGGTITTGGRAWKHNCSVRIMFSKGAYIDEKGNELKRSTESPFGNIVMMNVLKTKVCKPDRKVGFYTLSYFTGINVIMDTVELALRYNFINQAGAWFNFIDFETGEILQDEDGEEIKLQGKSKVIEYLEHNKELFENIQNEINKLIWQSE